MKYIVCKNAEDAIKKCKNGLNTKHFQPPSNLPPKTSDLPPKTSEHIFICSLLSVKQNSF